MFEALKKNLEHEKKIVADMYLIQQAMESGSGNRAFYKSGLKSLSEQLALMNKAVPELLKEWSPITKFVKKVAGKKVVEKKVVKEVVEEVVPEKKVSVVKMSYVSPSTKEKKYLSINKKDKSLFLKNLKMSEDALSGLKKMKKKDVESGMVKPNFYAKFSNRLFRKYSDKLAPQFSSLADDLKKANIGCLLSSYLSMAIFSVLIAFVVGVLVFVVLIISSLSNWMYFVLPFGLVGLVLAGFYLYPSSEASSAKKKISQELPFVTIHMAAISGSDIEPTKIFKIILRSEEYPNVAKEIKKVIVQTDIYGYDLVTSLKNVSMKTSNKKLGELLSGLATNISTGGALKNYLEKRAEDFLLDYKLEREQYSDLAGTFMDVYISILIAAPLVLMMMFIVMNVSGLGTSGLGITALLSLSIVGIVIVNIIFIVVLNLKQPKV